MASGLIFWGPASMESTTNSPIMVSPPQKKGKVFLFLISNKKNLDDSFSFRMSVNICWHHCYFYFITVIFIINRLPLLNYCKLTRWSDSDLTHAHKMPLFLWCHSLEWSPVTMDLAYPFSAFGTNTIHHLIFPQRKSKAYQCVKKNQLKSKAKFLHLEICFLLKDLHSMAETPRVQRVNKVDDLDKISPSVCLSVKTVASKLLSEW